MPTYKYQALTARQENVNGVIEAFDEFAAIDMIRASCPIITSIEEVSEKESLLQMEVGSQKIDLGKLSILCSQFAIVLRAGMPIVRSVDLMATQTKDKKLKKLLKEVKADVAGGYSLADSFESKGAGRLPSTFVETVRAGEESGTLEIAFDNLRKYYEGQSKVKDKVKAAMMYPVFLLALAGIVIAIVLGVAIPVFAEQFAELDIEMPALTRIVIAFANLVRNRWYILVGIICAVIILYKFYASTEGGRVKVSKLAMQLPVIGNVTTMKASSQLANTLTTLLSAGLPLIRSVAVTSKVLDNYYMSLRFSATVPKLEEGRSLGECLTESGVFPDMLVEMTSMGEETGTLEDTLRTIGIHYDNEVNIATQKALDVLQPAITVILGVIIGVIVVALYLPMFTMYAGL